MRFIFIGQREWNDKRYVVVVDYLGGGGSAKSKGSFFTPMDWMVSYSLLSLPPFSPLDFFFYGLVLLYTFLSSSATKKHADIGVLLGAEQERHKMFDSVVFVGVKLPRSIDPANMRPKLRFLSLVLINVVC